MDLRLLPYGGIQCLQLGAVAVNTQTGYFLQHISQLRADRLEMRIYLCSKVGWWRFEMTAIPGASPEKFSTTSEKVTVNIYQRFLADCPYQNT
jgi:hypothetical protein